MNHLRQYFLESLSDGSNFFVKDGFVHIRSRYWSSADLLELFAQPDGKNEVFDELFSEWIEEHREEKIIEANEILEQFGQKDRFLRLIEAYKCGAVVPFVGAGMSSPSGYPGWTNFLRQQRRQTLISEPQFEELIRKGLYEEAAQRISDALGVGFSEAVDAAFGCSRNLCGPVEMLPYVFDSCVVTTNFDNVLERCFANAAMQFSEKFDGCESQEIRRSLAANKRFLLMLHGKATSGRGRVLTKSEYDSHYVGEITLAKTIKIFCDSKSLLFLGCSLSVDRTLTEIRKYVNEEGHDQLPKHYAFLAAPTTDEERLERQQCLAECHIYPIWYPAGCHDESIEALLTKLQSSAL